MPFWRRKTDPELDAARAEAEAALPPGWQIHRSDLESFRVPTGVVETYGICAVGPGDESALVVAVGEANAYRHFARHVRGELDVADGWAVPLAAVAPRRPLRVSVSVEVDDEAAVAARLELEEALPPGWVVYDVDRERYSFPLHYLETYAVAVGGPAGESELVVAVGKAGALRQMARRLRGELDVADAWAPPMQHRTPR